VSACEGLLGRDLGLAQAGGEQVCGIVELRRLEGGEQPSLRCAQELAGLVSVPERRLEVAGARHLLARLRQHAGQRAALADLVGQL
jgi:hypothetical protein